MRSLLITFSFLLPAVINANNDWDTPCFKGSCSYGMSNTTHGVSSGIVSINGSTTAISDITPAAGWTILSCDQQATEQNITAICTGSNNDCNHLYQNGAINTIVRLPENCGKTPFARVAAEWTHANQSIPHHIAQKLRRRGNSNTTVRGIALDIHFSKVDPNHHGHVTLMIQGATGNNTASTQANPNQARDPGLKLKIRSLLGDIGNAIKGAAQAVGNAVTSAAQDVGNAVTSAAKDVGSDIKNGVDDALSAAEQSFDFNKTGSAPFSVDKSFNIVEHIAACPATTSFKSGFSAAFNVSVDVNASGSVSYGVTVTGTLVPPNITDFELFAGLEADLNGTLGIIAQGEVSVQTGSLTLFEVGIPGLDFPGILTIGPTFGVYANTVATLSANVQANIGINYDISGVNLYFPPGKGKSSGSFKPKDTPITLVGDPTIAATGSLTANLIPAISFGINALGGLAEANVDLNLDASAAVRLTFLKSNSTSKFIGCADLTTGLSVNAGATASFFSLFNKATTVPLWDADYELANNCFNTARGLEDRELKLLDMSSKRAVTNAFTCGTLIGPGTMQTALSQTVLSSNIQQIPS